MYVSNIEYFPVSAGNCFEDDFETGQLQNAWTYSFADATTTLTELATLPSGVIGVFNDSGFNSAFGVAMGKACDDGFSSNALDLHLNLTAATEVELYFDILDNADETQNDDGIYLSDNGGVSFIKALDFHPGSWCDQYGQFPPIQIHKLAEELGLDLSANFIIRFQQYDDGDFGFRKV